LKYFEIMALGQPLDHDQRSVCNWINDNKPLEAGEDKFIVHIEDLVSPKKKFESSRQNDNRIESILDAYANGNPKSVMTVCKMNSCKTSDVSFSS
jgi:hypothetical protein